MSTISSATFAKYARDPTAFRDALVIDAAGTARRLGDVIEPWQREDFAAVDPGLLRAIGRSTEPASSRVYLERPRGHSKTTDLAAVAVYALAFSARPIRGYCFAATRDQAALLRDAIATLVRLNPWLAAIIDVERDRIVNRAEGHPGQGGALTISASDVGPSYGILPDIIIADELCHWSGDGGLWHSLLSSAAKRENCLLVVISNAGFVDSWQWGVREAARTDPSWTFRRLDGPVASWLSPARLDEQRRMLPAVAFSRLWLNCWSSGAGDALRPDDIAAAFDPTAQRMRPTRAETEAYSFVGGLDLGVKRDASALVVLAVPRPHVPDRRIRLADACLWRPGAAKVDLAEVERTIRAWDARFGFEAVAFDPWNCESLAQRIEADKRRRSDPTRYGRQPFMREVAPTSASLREQATLTVEGFADRRFVFFDYAPLRRDLERLRAVEKSYGLRLESPRDAEGHGDTFSAFATALVVGHEFAGKRPKRVIGGRIGETRSETELADLRARHAWLTGFHPTSGTELWLFAFP